jgi:uncharacterized membrane-anchored protein YitT (DUF2179 family)
MTEQTPPSAAKPQHHDWLDDGHALVIGVLFVTLGMTMFAHVGLLTGGVAGVAFLLHYALGWNLSLCFLALSMPFFWLSWKRLGIEFTLKSMLSVVLVSACTALAPKVVRFEVIDPWVASVLGGLLIGMGLLALLRHHASVGGVNILAQWLQQTRGISAGKVQMAVDVFIVATALTVVSPMRLAQSIVSAIIISVVLVLNHKPGRYLGV